MDGQKYQLWAKGWCLEAIDLTHAAVPPPPFSLPPSPPVLARVEYSFLTGRDWWDLLMALASEARAAGSVALLDAVDKRVTKDLRLLPKPHLTRYISQVGVALFRWLGAPRHEGGCLRPSSPLRSLTNPSLSPLACRPDASVSDDHVPVCRRVRAQGH